MTLLTDGPAELAPEDAERLAAAGVEVDERVVAGIDGPDATLTRRLRGRRASGTAPGCSCR